MIREEAIRCLSVYSSTNGSGLCTDEQHYEAKQMAIKALEQGSKMLSEIEHLHKYISKLETQIVEQESVLDKIRVEIEALEEGITSYHDDRPWIFKDEVLAIIDKYKAESER